MPDPKLSVVLLARSLEVGGAERQLVELAKGLHGRGHGVRVALFYKSGALAPELERQDIEIIDLGKAGRWDLLRFFTRTTRTMRRIRPDLLYSFLGGPNVVAAALRLFLPGLKIVWSIRASNMNLGRYDWTHGLAYRIERIMSALPDIIIANSAAGRNFAVGNGFPGARIRVVANGIDTDRFRPDGTARRRQRQAWGVGGGEIAIGMVARLDPMKGHCTFLRAAASLLGEFPEFRFFCVGAGPEKATLESLARETGVEDHLTFTGHASDPAAAINGLDIICSASSFGEGFSNSIAEAMACGKSCAVTDVGDSALIVGDLGTVAPPDDPQALRSAILRELSLRSPARSAAARKRIVDCYSINAMVEGTLAVFDRVALRQDLPTLPESRS